MPSAEITSYKPTYQELTRHQRKLEADSTNNQAYIGVGRCTVAVTGGNANPLTRKSCIHCWVSVSKIPEEVMRQVNADELYARIDPNDAPAGAIRPIAVVGHGIAHFCLPLGMDCEAQT